MKYGLLLLLTLSLLSCSKELSIDLGDGHKLTIPSPDWNNLCNEKIAMFGNSFTVAWNEYGNAFSPVYSLAALLRIDTMSYHYDGTDWHWNQRKGDSMIYMGGVSGERSYEITARYLTHPELWSHVLIIESGRNNGRSENTRVLADIATMISKHKGNKYFVLGVLPGDWEHEWKGTATQDKIDSLNTTLHQFYGEHYIDVKAYLMARATKSYEDSMCVVHGVTPTSLRVAGDPLHLNSLGSYYMAEAVFVKSKTCN